MYIETFVVVLYMHRGIFLLYDFSFAAAPIEVQVTSAFTFISMSIQEVKESKINQNLCQQYYNESLWHIWHVFLPLSLRGPAEPIGEFLLQTIYQK